MLLGEICVDRLFGSPIVIAALASSRLVARFDRAKRLTSYALAIEVLTLVLVVALLLFSVGARRE
jgi:cytochrome c biogenesis protein CcdA